jgi:GNAT superfamily N-acetyltransferase
VSEGPGLEGPELDVEFLGGVLRGTQVADLRPVRPDELVACARIWRAANNDYTVPLGQVEIPDDLGAVTRLYGHLQVTDPDTFVVAVRREEGDGERVVAFGAAVSRGETWFLSMLFVAPEEQGLGLGTALIERLLPASTDDRALATVTDSLQPISNALYSRFGMVPRMPMFHAIGSILRPDAFPRLPDGVDVVPLDPAIAVADEIDTLDLEVLGHVHPQDHAYVRAIGGRAFVFRDDDGRALAYGYGSDVGRVGPVAARDEALLPAILGHLVRAVQPRGAYAVWVPGAAGPALTTLLEAGLRLDGFPVLVCWSRPFVDFSRYLPNSPGLL